MADTPRWQRIGAAFHLVDAAVVTNPEELPQLIDLLRDELAPVQAELKARETKTEEDARKEEAALFKKLMALLEVPMAPPPLGPIWSSLTKNKLWEALTCYRETVFNLLLSKPIPEFQKSETTKKKRKRGTPP